MTETEQKTIDTINSMSHEAMARLSRFGLSGHPYFDTTLPYYKVFNARFESFGGWNPALSKKIGWGLP